MKSFALLLLLLTPQDAEIDSLLKQFTEGSIEERDKAAKALVERGDAHIPRLKSAMAAMPEDLRLVMAGILDRLAVSRELRAVLSPVCRVSIVARERPVQDVLKDFQIQTRVPMQFETAGPGKITVTVKDVGALEALDAICKAADLAWYLGHQGEKDDRALLVRLHRVTPLMFRPGYSANRRKLFLRQYQVEVEGTEMRNRQAAIKVGVRWPVDVNPVSVELTLTSVLDDGGRDIPKVEGEFGGRPGPRETRFPGGWNLYAHHETWAIQRPADGTESRLTVKGKATFRYIVREKVVRFDLDDFWNDASKQIDGTTASITHVRRVYPGRGGETHHTVEFQIKDRQSNVPPRARILGKNGEVLEVLHPFKEDKDVFLFYLKDALTKENRVELAVDLFTAADEVEFELKDIPLTK